MMYFIAFSFGYMATFVSSDISRNISVQMSLFFNGLWRFVIKIISAFKRSKKCVDGQCTQQIKFTTIPGTNLALSSIFQNVTSHAKT